MKYVNLAVLACSTLLAGCAVGPDFKRPEAPVGDRFTPDTDEVSMRGAPSPEKWWTVFQSQALDSLVQQALTANHDYKAAQAALRAANESRAAQAGTLFPTIDGGGNLSRNKDATGVLAPTLASGAPVYTLATASVSVSYPIDLFGGVRRELEATGARAEAQKYQTQAAALTVASNVALAAINEGALRGQIAATEQIIGAEENSLSVMEREVTLGQIAESDAIAERAALAQTRAMLPPLKQKLAQQRSALAVLLGHTPRDDTDSQFALDSFTLPKSLPLSLPSTVVDRRPDVRAAEATYHAALAEVGVATANMLPNITITGDAGSSAPSFDTLFTPGTGFWHLAAGLTQPLFQAGALVHKRRAAVAAAAQAEELYQSAVLTALQSVSDVLHALANDTTLVSEAQVAANAAAQSLTIVQKQIEFGQVSGLALLEAQRVYQQAVVTLMQAKAARLSDVVALFQALGGGWEAAPASNAAGSH